MTHSGMVAGHLRQRLKKANEALDAIFNVAMNTYASPASAEDHAAKLDRIVKIVAPAVREQQRGEEWP